MNTTGTETAANPGRQWQTISIKGKVFPLDPDPTPTLTDEDALADLNGTPRPHNPTVGAQDANQA